MADTKITAMVALTGANTAAGDKIPIIDVGEADADKNKSITRDELLLSVNALTANTDPLDDDIGYMVDDPAGTPAARKMALRHNRWFGASIPYFTGAGIHLSHPCGSVASAVAVVANRLYVHPVIVPYRRAFTSIACYGTTATGNVRMGIYNPVFSAANGWAIGTLVAETASTAVAGSAITTAAITATLDPGAYFLAADFDNTPTMRFWGAGAGPIQGTELAAAPNTSPPGSYSAHAYGALPNLTGVGQTFASVVCVGIR